MTVSCQRLRDATLLHDDEGGAVSKTPLLVVMLMIKIKGLIENLVR